MEQCKVNLSSSDSEKKRLEESLKSFQAKAKKYDDISAQGVRSLIQMNAFNEKADVREKERESRRSQARSVLGMVRQSSVNNRTDGYVGNHRHEDDIARKRKRVSDDFMARSQSRSQYGDRSFDPYGISQLSQRSYSSRSERGRSLFGDNRRHGIPHNIQSEHKRSPNMESVTEERSYRRTYSHQSFEDAEDGGSEKSIALLKQA